MSQTVPASEDQAQPEETPIERRVDSRLTALMRERRRAQIIDEVTDKYYRKTQLVCFSQR